MVTDPEKRKALSVGMFAKFLKQSPFVIVACGNKRKSPKWHVVDTATAVQNMVLAATSERLATCWIASFSESQVRDLLKILENLRIVALLAVGYFSDKESFTSRALRAIRRRKRFEKIVSQEEYGKPYSKRY